MVKPKLPIQKPYLLMAEVEARLLRLAWAKAKTVSVIGKAQLLRAVAEVPNKRLHRIRLLLSDGRVWLMKFDYRKLSKQQHAERIQRVLTNIRMTHKQTFEEVS